MIMPLVETGIAVFRGRGDLLFWERGDLLGVIFWMGGDLLG